VDNQLEAIEVALVLIALGILACDFLLLSSRVTTGLTAYFKDKSTYSRTVLKGTPIQELMIALSRVMKIFSEDSLAQKEQPVREQWKVLKEDFHQAKTRYNAIYLTSELAYFLAHLDCLGEGATRVYITNLFWLCKKKSTVVEFLRQFCVGLESTEFEDEILSSNTNGESLCCRFGGLIYKVVYFCFPILSSN
jgi:hypothetical protein